MVLKISMSKQFVRLSWFSEMTNGNYGALRPSARGKPFSVPLARVIEIPHRHENRNRDRGKVIEAVIHGRWMYTLPGNPALCKMSKLAR